MKTLANVRSRLIERLLETLSLAEHYEERNPTNQITRAALQEALRDLIRELNAIAEELQPEESDEGG